jgi:hypothetical protein
MIAVMSFTTAAGARGRAAGQLPSAQLSPAPPMRQYGPARRARTAVLLATLAGTCAVLLGAPVAPAGAQRLTRPDRPWVTLETRHFRVHAPRDLAGWARAVAERLDAVRASEARVVGFVPPGLTDVVVDDPQNDPNGSAYPFLRGPAVFVWPVPPSPRTSIGNSRQWGEGAPGPRVRTHRPPHPSLAQPGAAALARAAPREHRPGGQPHAALGHRGVRDLRGGRAHRLRPPARRLPGGRAPRLGAGGRAPELRRGERDPRLSGRQLRLTSWARPTWSTSARATATPASPPCGAASRRA